MGWNIHLIDDFLPKEVFDNIYKNIDTLSFPDQFLHEQENGGKPKHVWFSSEISPNDDFIKIVRENVKKKFRQEVKRISTAAWTLANSQEPCPHVDREEFPGEKHLMIYLKGTEEINSGTGFYIAKDEKSAKGTPNQYDLNTHIGFKENRAVLFTAKDCCHSPLLWNSQSMGRYAALVWFESVDII